MRVVKDGCTTSLRASSSIVSTSARLAVRGANCWGEGLRNGKVARVSRKTKKGRGGAKNTGRFRRVHDGMRGLVQAASCNEPGGGEGETTGSEF